jgi:hypothetical protein
MSEGKRAIDMTTLTVRSTMGKSPSHPEHNFAIRYAP